MRTRSILRGALCVGWFLVQGHLATADDRLEIPLWAGQPPGPTDYRQQEHYEVRPDGIGWMTGVSVPTLTIHKPVADIRSGAAVVICPGGGYVGLAVDHEGHVLAEWFAKRGVLAGLLKYRHNGPFQHPIPLGDAQRALRLMRSRAAAWQIDPERIGIAGFSAGGHVASTAATHFDEGDPAAADAIDRLGCRPAFLVLAYPVISMRDEIAHQVSRKLLLGKNPTEEQLQEVSNDEQVTEETPPTFLAHCEDDPAVVVEHSLRFYQALRKHQVSAELHIYESGGHGFGMYRRDRPSDRWPDQLEGWLQQKQLIRSR